MKKIIFTVTMILFTVCILAMTIRGIEGNPTPEEILIDLRSEGKPFELSPERGRYALLTSIVDDKSLSFKQEIAEYVVPDLGYINGKYVSLFAPGVSFIAIPFYILGKTVNLGQVFTFGVSGLFALLNVFLISVIVNKFTKNLFAGIVAGLTFLFATVAWPYAVTFYQHHITTFLLLLSTYVLTFKTNFTTAFLVSSLFGISIFIGYPNAVFFVPFLIFLVIKHVDVKEINNSLSITIKLSIILGIVALATSLIPTYLYNYHAHDDPLQLAGTVQTVKEIKTDSGTGQVIMPSKSVNKKSATKFFDPSKLPNGMSVLLTSRDRGLIWFSPIILLGIFGIYPLYKKNKDIAYTLIAGVIAILFLYGMWGDPWGGWAFGPRYLIPAMGLMSIFLGVALATYGKKFWFTILYFPLLAYSLFVSLIGTLTTNQIPPSVEVDSVNYPQFTFLHNLDLIHQGKSGSFIYNTFLSNSVSLTRFALILFISVLLIISLNYVFLFLKIKKGNTQ